MIANAAPGAPVSREVYPVNAAEPTPVRVFTLGGFELEVHGKPLRFQRKLPRRPLALMKVLIAFGAREVPETGIADALWPDADADAARQSLGIALHRLRSLLAGVPALQRRGGMLSLNADVAWTDVWALQAMRGVSSPQGEQELIRALSLYRGPFLASELDAAWTMPARERLRATFMELVRRLVSIHEQRDDAIASETVWLRALEAEPDLEPLYIGLLQSQLQKGRSGAALEVYQRCQAILAAVGRVPSRPLRDLVRGISYAPIIRT
jgi:DNA-binding SARP family transcriptional activator